MSMVFSQATRKKAKLRLGITGPSGSGKSWGALLLAKGLGGRIAVIDTEHDSASLYAGSPGMPDFDTLSLQPPYAPERFIEAMRAAQSAGYSVLIIDSITHEWNGMGGCLELVDQVARSKYRGNSWSAWNEITPRHRAFIDSMLASPMHVIGTMRSKTETAQTDGPTGKKQVVKLGMKAEQREGSEYEFTIVLDLVHDGHYATASKDRSRLFLGDPQPISEETGRRLRDWLESGEEAEILPAPPALEPPKQGILSGPITPTTGAWEDVDPAREPHIRSVAMTANEYWEVQDVQAAYATINDAGLDNDEKRALWTCFDSKMRAALKKHAEEMRAAA